VIVGFQAVDDLVAQHPGAHRAFGVESAERLALLLSMPGWLVMAENNCWVALRRLDDTPICELHWFCHPGADIKAVRSMLRYAFEERGVTCVLGPTVPGHPFARAAATLARALGAVRVKGVLVLTAERFSAYNYANLRVE